MKIEPKLPTIRPLQLETELSKLVGADVADQSFAPKERQRSQFAVIGHQAIDAMIQAAEDVRDAAQKELERVKERAEEMRENFDARDLEIQAMMERVRGFGTDQLNAHQRFTNGTPDKD